MHSSAQVPFSSNGPALIAALDTQAGLQQAATPLAVKLVDHDLTHGDHIVGTSLVNFLLWPSGYLKIELDPGCEIHVTEFEDSASPDDIGSFLVSLFVNRTQPSIPPFTGWKDTIYTAGVDPLGTLHKPSARYLIVWVDGASGAARGTIRAQEAASAQAVSVQPSVIVHDYYTGGM